MDGTEALDRVRTELELYRHPFFELSASTNGETVDVSVRSTVPGVHTPEYRFTLTPKEIDHPRFRWSFQALLYGSLNDYMVELFTKTPETASSG